MDIRPGPMRIRYAHLLGTIIRLNSTYPRYNFIQILFNLLVIIDWLLYLLIVIQYTIRNNLFFSFVSRVSKILNRAG